MTPDAWLLDAGLLVEQAPPWPDGGELAGVVRDLGARPPLVAAAACHSLRAELAQVTEGAALVLQGGDCAEPFADSTSPRITGKADQLDALADMMESRADRRTVRIGRFAGQYAKPRSRPTEDLPGGGSIPVYRGDAVNAPEPEAAARRPDPRRLLRAYDHAAEALDALFVGGYIPFSGHRSGRPPVHTSHEALLLDFEKALVRHDPAHPGGYASSAHMLWIGERTRRLDGAHLEFARTVSNPVGVKLGPGADPGDVRRICAALTAGREPGRAALICRMGAGAARERLPALLEAAAPCSDRLVWLCDPMHGNTVPHVSGRKTRLMVDMLTEIKEFAAALHRHGTRPGGLHLEMTPDDVTECLQDERDLTRAGALRRYTTTCDPRLAPAQAETLVATAADLF